jgi:diguanylate cyclase (GGDEF)-like protein
MTSINRSIDQFTLRVALTISVLLAVLIPLIFSLVSYQYMRGVLDVRSALSADDVTRIIRSNPIMWRYEELRLSEILDHDTDDAVVESKRIFDTNGEIIAKNDVIVSKPSITRTHNIYDTGKVVARIEVSRPLGPLFFSTLLLAFFSSALAAGLFMLLRSHHSKVIKAAYNALGKSEKKYRSLYETMNEGMALHQACFDENGRLSSLRIIDYNPICAALFNRAPETLVGSDSHVLFGDNFTEFLTDLQQVLINKSTFAFEMSLPGMDRLFSVRAFSPEHGLIATFFEDITERSHAEQQIQKMAYIDQLTGLPNRALFLDRLGQAMARAVREKVSIALFFLDIDRFKNINDTLGHSAGDQLLKEVSQRFKRHIRTSDTLARLGGDEFVVIATNLGKELNASYVAQNLIDAFQAPFQLANKELHVTTSIGIAIFPDDGSDAENLLKNADMAMYSAKESGRNGFCFYSREMNSKAHQRLEMEAGLRNALHHNEFFLEFQPIMSVDGVKIVAAEALVRWQHPADGKIPPDQFISLAEETGLILPLGEWVLRTACGKIKAWNDAGLPQIRVSINVSSRQIEQKNFTEIVQSVIKDTGANPAQIEIELTESCLLNHACPNMAKVFSLRESGISIAIDDFGTGFSSLSYIKALPIDHIKIDKSFIDDVCGNKQDQAIVEAILAMSKKLDIRNVAEGVETVEQLQFLQQQGCSEIQGYYFHRPLPAEMLEELLREQGEC